ncbi:MAG: hypothetical protein M3Z56_10760 [Bacteroidota bacterium]|nr:hypothetical protein [Bacteroidota bacterium]
MRKAKWLIVGFLLMMFFFFGITLLLPSKVTVSKSIIINASLRKVAEQIQDFNNWKNWYPAFRNKDISITLDYNLLISSAILKDKKGHEIKFSMNRNQKDTINIELHSNEKTLTYQFIISTNKENNTQVIWNVNINLGSYPWRKIQGLVMDKINGPEYELALQNLKKATEGATIQTMP